MKLRNLFFAVMVVVAAGCFIATGNPGGQGCKVDDECGGNGYRCVSASLWPQTACPDGDTGCVCEIRFPPDGTGFDAGPVDAGPPPDSGTWCADIRPLFLRSCIATCHSYMPSWPNAPKDFRLDAYEPPAGFPGVKAKLDRVKARNVDTRDMPPITELLAFPFSNAERDQVAAWYRAGGPEGAGPCDVIILIDAGTGDGGTDGGLVSFANVVVPIFQTRCSPCHTTNTSGGLSLTAANAYTNLVGPNATCNTAVKRVTPSNTQNSMLWRKLMNTADKCGNAMPNMTAGLATTQPAEFAKIQSWIQQGALNN